MQGYCFSEHCVFISCVAFDLCLLCVVYVCARIYYM